VAPNIVEQIARVLRQGRRTLIMVGGSGLREAGLEAAHRISSATGARLLAQQSNARIARGRGRASIERMPYPVDAARGVTAGVEVVILAGARRPVAFFAYPGKPSYLFPEDAAVHVLTRPEQDTVDALVKLADAIVAPQAAVPDAGPRSEPAQGKPEPERVARTLAAVMPEQAIVAEEAVSFGRGFFRYTHAAPPHDWLQITGGAIGCGFPLATGAAIAAPGRRVISLEADGSAMYTVQALWTQARERLDITTIVFANRKYAILLGELANVGANPGRTALDMMDLGNPDLDWVRIASGMGVEGARAETCEQLADLLGSSFRRSGPFLIELLI
ncbi:MAG: acetolactate synthase large subunit, partial [Acetobacteraceae bacterium]|nr:acetolactate synthase large subunit [Acetobacteraceae bacterium]